MPPVDSSHPIMRSGTPLRSPPLSSEPSSAKAPFIIGVAGGTASGKTTVCDQIMQRLANQRVVVISQDSFYRGLTEEEMANVTKYNFDHPDAFDMVELAAVLAQIRQGEQVEVPEYDFVTHQRSSEVRLLPKGVDVVIIEGILVFHDDDARDLMQMKIFVDTDADTRLARRIRRDTVSRGRDVDSVIEQYSACANKAAARAGQRDGAQGLPRPYRFPPKKLTNLSLPQSSMAWSRTGTVPARRRVRSPILCGIAWIVTGKFVKPMFDQFVAPTKKYADIIVPRGGDNPVAVDLITQHILLKLGQNDLRKHYPRLVIMPSNFQTKGMHTIIRARDTSRDDFVFYSDRLIRLVVEHGLGSFPFAEKAVITPTGDRYTGVDFSRRICGVSIIRSGESMENALRACCKGIKIGKMLVQRGKGAHEGEGSRVLYTRLPQDIAERKILLLDPILATGNSIIAAIAKLVEFGVRMERIVFICLIAAPEGIRNLFSVYPTITIVTTEVDEGLDARGQVIPGIGNFGDRYFGTDQLDADDLGCDGPQVARNDSVVSMH